MIAAKNSPIQAGFTIVELLIVIVVIAILAAITVVAYNGISNQAKESALKNELRDAATQLQVAKVESGAYPISTNSLKRSNEVLFQYDSDNTASTFCLTATHSELAGKAFYIENGGPINDGPCSGDVVNPAYDGTLLQAITTSNCSTSRIVAVDARDNHTYWVQKMPDGRCWMLTNLAYAGGTSNGGGNTYGDIKTLANGSSDTTPTYLAAKYYIHSSSNPTIYPDRPSLSTDNGQTNPQRGYLYNWCAAMGVQTSTSACANATTPVPDASTSVCPAGWRLPTGTPTTGELTLLANAIGATNDTSGSTNLRTEWLAQYGGAWTGSPSYQGAYGYFWSATQSIASRARMLRVGNVLVYPSPDDLKHFGFSIRCIAT